MRTRTAYYGIDPGTINRRIRAVRGFIDRYCTDEQRDRLITAREFCGAWADRGGVGCLVQTAWGTGFAERHQRAVIARVNAAGLRGDDLPGTAAADFPWLLSVYGRDRMTRFVKRYAARRNRVKLPPPTVKERAVKTVRQVVAYAAHAPAVFALVGTLVGVALPLLL